MTDIRFPEGFLWGAATSAYQVEGSPLADGAGVSNWHRFSHTPRMTHDGDTGDVACDHYRRWADDVALMAKLGLRAYRFSISWSRVFPAGTGRINRAGLDFYERLVDALLARGITPNATLYHWDLPAALDDRGGWLNPDIAGWFADYAAAVFRALDDRVPMWSTLNEPWVVMHAGYVVGEHAPGHRSVWEAPRVSHNLLRAHASAVRAYRSMGRNRIGLVVNLEPRYAASDRPEDLAARARAEAYMNRQYLDPVFHGRYPDELREIFGEAWPEHADAEAETLREPIDWLGINYYTRSVMRDDPSDPPVRAGRVRQDRHTHTEMGWEVYPPALTDVLVWVRERYGEVPLYVTENGAAFYDPPVAERGEVDDPLRVAYYRDHLRAAHEAIRRGVDLRGYFAWSLLDNFEWSAGYARRFGIVHVDLQTQKRTPKRSARFYADVIRTNGAVLGSAGEG
ncbi:MAG TPA: GH1 family beta-glucosidase [Longimicrobium sp.]|nr:GH1 family beta-glucosidase [Longimicrobium sp.]